MSDPKEDFTEGERRALDAWQVDDPPPGLAERVMAKHVERPRARSVLIGVALAASMVALVAGLGRARHASGEHFAQARTTVAIAKRAVAVMEPGARLSYAAGGSVEVSQDAGNVFYRVDRARGAFVVRTIEGTVTVAGTCFRVEVNGMNAKKAGLIGAASGALLASTVMVTVYEGKVVTASPKGEVVVEAGEGVELSRDAAPRKLSLPASALRTSAVPLVSGERIPATQLSEAQDVPSSPEIWAREKQSLETKVSSLEKELEAVRSRSSDTKTYDLDAPTLAKMAERCELRWDTTTLKDDKPQRVPTQDLEDLELAESEREVIDRTFAASHRRLVDEIRRTYVEITGDDSTSSMSVEAMFEEVQDKVPRSEVQRVFQQIARERAGLAPVAAPKSPIERMFRVVSGEGDQLERDLAGDLGPETAKRLRDLHEGWSSRSRSSFGCPGE